MILLSHRRNTAACQCVYTCASVRRLSRLLAFPVQTQRPLRPSSAPAHRNKQTKDHANDVSVRGRKRLCARRHNLAVWMFGFSPVRELASACVMLCDVSYLCWILFTSQRESGTCHEFTAGSQARQFPAGVLLLD